jgi:hypothetical protein
MIYFATWRAHGQTYESGPHDTLLDAQRAVFGRPSAPTRGDVTFWQVLKESTD